MRATRVVQIAWCMTVLLIGDARVPVRASQARRSAAMLLDDYAAGRHEAVAADLARVRDFGALKDDLARLISGRMKPIASDGQRRDALVAAAFVLEVLSAGFEMEWRQLAPLLEVACQLIRSRGPADDAERVWMLGSIALAGGARDRMLLDAHLPHARARFSTESRFQLAEATAAEIGADYESMPISTGASPEWQARKRIAINGLAALTKVPAISAEAELHVGYLLFQIGDRKQALAHLRLADQTTDAFVRYLSRFLAGRIMLREKQDELAEQAFRDALAVLPGTQSASQALATLLFIRGRSDDAYTLLEASFSHRPLLPDPWRLYGYGDFRRWPTLRDQLRAALK